MIWLSFIILKNKMPNVLHFSLEKKEKSLEQPIYGWTAWGDDIVIVYYYSFGILTALCICVVTWGCTIIHTYISNCFEVSCSNLFVVSPFYKFYSPKYIPRQGSFLEGEGSKQGINSLSRHPPMKAYFWSICFPKMGGLDFFFFFFFLSSEVITLRSKLLFLIFYFFFI